jgi:hypothetical protein
MSADPTREEAPAQSHSQAESESQSESELERQVAGVLGRLPDETSAGHVEAYDEIHRALREALADAGSARD